jgi:lysophospholipase L1-like esterase
MSNTGQRWFQRHPLAALLAVNLAALAALVLVLEILVRVFITYNPGFYTAVKVKGRDLEYAYGVIKVNSEGFPDEEWDLSKTLRVGYFGDSVTYGVGAGYGYRFSEILEESYPEYEHMNIAGIGLTISENEIQWASELAQRLGMQKVFYFFNLNDIVPDAVAAGEQTSSLTSLRAWLLLNLDWLRGRSYLYTFVRTRLKTFYSVRGRGFHGYTAYEFFPRRHEQILGQTAERIHRFQEALANRGIELIVVILPYEMQISREAELRYAELGVQWEGGFIDGETQQRIIAALDPELRSYDAYEAFVDRGAVEETRRRNGLGEYFVYNKGDKLDWNHPNRSGHRAIAEWLTRVDVLGPDDGSGPLAEGN